VDDRVSVAGNCALDHLEPDQLPRDAAGAEALDRRAPHEIPLGRLDDPAEPSLEWTGGLVDVIAVERELHLEPERVAGAEADRLDAVAVARLDQCAPERLGAGRGRVELEAVLARITGPGDDRGHPRDRAADEMVVRHARHVRVREPPDQRLGLRALHREERRLRAHVRPPRRAAAVRRDPCPVLVDVRRVYCEHEPVVVQAVERQVVHDAALRIAEERVLDLADGEDRCVVGGEPLDDRERVGSGDLELAHVADVEESHGAAHRPVLLDDPGVLHGHLPTAEGNHLRARLAVDVVERGALERACRWDLRHGSLMEPALILIE
jgi:hypothetical protein